MDKSNKDSDESRLFNQFIDDPMDSNVETIQGAHRYISLSIRGDVSGPKKSVLVDLFREFLIQPVKDYVFARMSKSILLELALHIFQDLIANGPERARELELALENAQNGGKRIVIADIPKDQSSSADSSVLVDTAFFRLSDKSGSSPDKKFAAGKGVKPSYVQPDNQGYFTPNKSARKSLINQFEVK